MADVRDRLHGYPSRPQRFNKSPMNYGFHEGAGHMEPLEDHKPVSVGEGANTTGTGVHGHLPRDFSTRERVVRRYPSSGGLTYSETNPEFEPPEHGQYSTPRTVGTFERPLHRPDFSGAAAVIERGEGTVYAGRDSQVEGSAMT